MSHKKEIGERAKDLPQTALRIPEDIKWWIKEQAAKNRRSFNTEVICMIEQLKSQHENHA